MSRLEAFSAWRFSSKLKCPKILSRHSFEGAFTSWFACFLFSKDLRFVFCGQSFRAYFKLISKIIPVRDFIIWKVLLGCTVLKDYWNSSLDLIIVVTATRSRLNAPNCVVSGFWIKTDLLVAWETGVGQRCDRTTMQEELLSEDVWVYFDPDFITETYLIVSCEKWSLSSLDDIDTASNCTNGLLSWCYHVSFSTTSDSVTHITN